ncbi:MAG: L-threonylcarbamoyladenylate synthase [Paracoccaceae bacterium]|jgi:L-threonylcarbamoyladenylate synthase|nr:L-threonylcarbamoyladenylate synthase [Paracoccaceae bacterium]MDP7185987.1 L-threonylcarbamoyladenylate synthase [Paracoccaceae bacterium]
MPNKVTQLLPSTPDGVATAADLLGEGGLVSFPTETVYGLGADATNDTAVARIFAAKGRPSFNPLIAHVADIETAKRYVEWSDAAQKLADAFWPGPLSLVLPLKQNTGMSHLVTAGLPSLAIRIPAHPVAHQLLEAVGGPVAAPSANPSGKISATRATHVIDGLGGKIEAVIDGGDCAVGLESTIVGLLGEPALLRPGGVPAEDIEAALGAKLKHDTSPDTLLAPGQMSSHYAPGAAVRLNATDWQVGELRLGFGHVPCDLNLSESGDLIEAAANLFRHLHALDRMEGNRIAVSPIPDQGLGRAINDRLKRAAAPR